MIKTGFSFNVAVGHLPDVADRLWEIGYADAPIADRSSTFGFVRWMKTCRDKGLRPVYGVELAVTPRLGEKKPALDYWTFIARDRLAPLHDLIYRATSNPGAEPSLTYEQAQSTDLIAIAHERTLADRVDWAKTYLALTPATPAALYRAASRAGARTVTMPRNVYPRTADLEFYRVALGLRSSTQTYPQHVADDSEIIRAVKWFATADEVLAGAALRRELLASSTAQLTRAELLKPARPASLLSLCQAGAERLNVDINRPVYAERLSRELAMIGEKQFEDYFYLIAEMVAWAKARMVVGPARGSSCGSLACYLLGITAIDPIPHGLLFERFIDVTRADLPDIDLDFSEARRDLVFAHCEELYGDRVARLGSVGQFDVKSALNQIGVTLRIPQAVVDRVAETAIKRHMGDSRKSSTMADTLEETDAGRRMVAEFPESRIVARMEAHPRNATRHAAGLVATAAPVMEHVAVDARTKSTMCNKYDAEELNLLKVDVLGLTQLTVFERAMELIKVEPLSGWHERLPLDDPSAFEVLNNHKFCGVFQFEGAAMRSLARQVKFESLDDIVAATALVRPGPMVSGGTDKWIQRRMGREQVTYDHPLLEPYLRDTYGVPAYQEQILQIGREVGDLSWAEVTALRKAMSRSLGKEYFDQFGDKWKAAATAKGMPAAVAEKFWDAMCQYGAWAFNKAHSVSYAYVSYWCAWWKAHHPVEYACAVLDMQRDPDKQIELLRELKAEGVDYVPVDPARSTDRWVPVDGKLLGPLSNIVGIGPAKLAETLHCRRTGAAPSGQLAKLLAEPRTPVDSLYPIAEWLGREYPGGIEVNGVKVVSDVLPCAGVKEGMNRDVVVVATPGRIMPKDENEPAKVQKRHGRLVNPSESLVLFLRDDSGEVLAKIWPSDFLKFGRAVAERGRAGKAIYVVKGFVRDYRMISVSRILYIGDLAEGRVRAEAA